MAGVPVRNHRQAPVLLEETMGPSPGKESRSAIQLSSLAAWAAWKSLPLPGSTGSKSRGDRRPERMQCELSPIMRSPILMTMYGRADGYGVGVAGWAHRPVHFRPGLSHVRLSIKGGIPLGRSDFELYYSFQCRGQAMLTAIDQPEEQDPQVERRYSPAIQVTAAHPVKRPSISFDLWGICRAMAETDLLLSEGEAACSRAVTNGSVSTAITCPHRLGTLLGKKVVLFNGASNPFGKLRPLADPAGLPEVVDHRPGLTAAAPWTTAMGFSPEKSGH